MPEPLPQRKALGPRRLRHTSVVSLVALLVALLVAGGVVALVIGATRSSVQPVADGTGRLERSVSSTAKSATTPTPSGTLPETSAPVPAPSTTAPREPLTIVALGDSVPSATTCNCDGYVEQLGSWLRRETQRPTVVHNDAVGGWTTADVEKSLRSTATRADLLRADLVVVEIGANDFDFIKVADPECLRGGRAACWEPVVTELRDSLLRIIPVIRSLDSNTGVRVAVAGYWNVTVDGEVGRALGSDFVKGSDALTRLVNSTIESAARSVRAMYVDFYAPLKGDNGTRDPTGNLLDDGDHPNSSGHTLLTRALIDALVSTGAVEGWTPRACPSLVCSLTTG